MADDTAAHPQSRTYDAACNECGQSFQATRPWSRYCSVRCRKRHGYRVGKGADHPGTWKKVCLKCGAEFTCKRSNARFCSMSCSKAAWNEEHQEQKREADRKWVRDNPEARRESWLRYQDRRGREAMRERYAEIKADPEKWAAHQEYNRQYYAANRPARLARARQQQIEDPFQYNRSRHGTPWESLMASLLEKQDRRCYLCGDQLCLDSPRDVHLDHDHACCPKWRTCEICRRGLACRNCNLLIGLALDDPDRLRRIADNLERAAAGVRERMAQAEGVLL